MTFASFRRKLGCKWEVYCVGRLHAGTIGSSDDWAIIGELKIRAERTVSLGDVVVGGSRVGNYRWGWVSSKLGHNASVTRFV